MTTGIPSVENVEAQAAAWRVALATLGRPAAADRRLLHRLEGALRAVPAVVGALDPART